MSWRVPLAVPDLTGNEAEYVRQAIESTWISSSGPFVDRFETEFASFCDVEHAVGVSNGTVGLHLLMVALGVSAGDEVIVPSLTYIATANAVTYTGGTAVFVDVDPRHWTLDVAAVEAAITPRTVGIVAVHLYGHPADMEALDAVARRHGLFLVEDAAEAHGARYRGRPVGGLATAAVFSFYGNKIVTSGEGGAITTSDGALMERIRLLRGQGMDPDRRYFFPVVGYNYRLTNVACALLCAQLERIEDNMRWRTLLAQRYDKGLGGLPGLSTQPKASWADPVTWLYSVTVDPEEFGSDREALTSRLVDVGVETRPFFVPLHLLPPYELSTRRGLPVTERLGATGLNLPTHHEVGETEIETVVKTIVAAGV